MREGEKGGKRAPTNRFVLTPNISWLARAQADFLALWDGGSRFQACAQAGVRVTSAKNLKRLIPAISWRAGTMAAFETRARR